MIAPLKGYKGDEKNERARASYSKAVDRELIAKYQAGDTGVINVLIQKYHERALNIPRNFGITSMADREDIAQEAFLRVHRNLDKFDGSRAAFSTWFYTIVGNLSRDKLKWKRRKGRD